LLQHDRPIQLPCDDSVVALFREAPYFIRRSRGFAPSPLRLPTPLPPLLAVGAELKNTFCLAREHYAFLSQHIGDMGNWETLQAFEDAVAHLGSLFRVKPELVACDLHPAYLSTQWAHSYTQTHSLPLYPIQHHHAHLASLLAEHGFDSSSEVIGITFDGTGYGADGSIWGGEVLIGSIAGYRRVAALRPIPLPGGDAAIKRPYRTALAFLWAAGLPWTDDLPSVAAAPIPERALLQRQFETGFRTVPCSSMGRLFDAVASLCNLHHSISYEGQAAVALEHAAAGAGPQPGYTLPITPASAPRSAQSAKSPNGQPLQFSSSEVEFWLESAPLIQAIVEDVRHGVPVSHIAARVHTAIAECTVQLALLLHRRVGLDTVALTGGVFQNLTLLEQTVTGLQQHGLRVLWHRRIPPNDGGLALGQAVIAHRLHAGNETSSGSAPLPLAKGD
jgi:hydrogenase maturation protein HypF